MRTLSRFLRTALTAALLCIVLSATAFAANYGTGVTTETLRLREGPSIATATLNTVSKGATVTVLEDQDMGWYKVEYKGTVGYMFSKYLTVTTNPAPTPTPTPAPTPDPAPTASTGKVNTGGSSLNMRSGPGTSYSKVGSIPSGATLTITGTEKGWYKTSYNGVSGYVSGDYVTLSQPNPGASTTPSTPATPETPSKPETPAEPKPETPAPAATTGTGKLNTGGSSLNMRSGPGTSYSKIGSIPYGATLTITASEKGWYKATYNGVSGYVSGDYVIFTPTASQTPTQPTTPSQPSSGTTSGLGAQVVTYAKTFLGIPYSYGANGPSAYDCSSFTQTVYKKFGYSLNRSASGQYSNGTSIELSQVQPGDLLLWRSYDSSQTATHVGIYIGNDMYIHASSTGGCITINNMSYGSSVRYLVGVRRIIK